MNVRFKIAGVDFDVVYSYEVHKDPLGTGDSPSKIEVTVEDIDVTGLSVPSDIFSQWALDRITEKCTMDAEEYL